MSYVTEAQAREKWCPHAVASHTDPRAGFHDDGRPIVHPCIGSACMSWRWFGFPADDAYAEAVKKAAEEIDDKTSNRRNAAAHVNANREKYGLSTERLGYCGLAGAPE